MSKSSCFTSNNGKCTKGCLSFISLNSTINSINTAVVLVLLRANVNAFVS